RRRGISYRSSTAAGPQDGLAVAGRLLRSRNSGFRGPAFSVVGRSHGRIPGAGSGAILVTARGAEAGWPGLSRSRSGGCFGIRRSASAPSFTARRAAGFEPLRSGLLSPPKRRERCFLDALAGSARARVAPVADSLLPAGGG